MSKQAGGETVLRIPDSVVHGFGSEAVSRENNATLMQQGVLERLRGMDASSRLAWKHGIDERVYDRGLYTVETEGRNRIPLVSVPVFLDRQEVERQTKMIDHVYDALVKTEELVYSDTAEGTALYNEVTRHMNPEIKTLVDAGRTRKEGTARRRNTRFDAFYNPSRDVMKILEINAVCPEGVAYHDVFTEAVIEGLGQLGMPTDQLEWNMQNSIPRQVLTALFEEFESRANGKPLQTIGIVYDEEGAATVNKAELPVLVDHFKALAKEMFGADINVVLNTAEHLQAQDGVMSMDGQQVDILWKNNLKPALYAGLGGKGTKEVPGLVEVITHPDKYIVFNDEAGRVMGYKSLLGYLYDPDVQRLAGFTPEEIQAIETIVPFTFNPAHDVRLQAVEDGPLLSPVEFLHEFRSRLVLKPNEGIHGASVVFGVNKDDMSETAVAARMRMAHGLGVTYEDGDTDWDIAIKAAMQGKMVAQEYIPYDLAEFEVPMIDDKTGEIEMTAAVMDTNFHHIGGRARGTSFCRVSRRDRFANNIGVLNIAAGGGARSSLVV